MKVLMLPHVAQFGKEESGIRRVVENYFTHLPDYGIELVLPGTEDFDLLAVHAGMSMARPDVPMVAHNHGLYWTADYSASNWEWGANANVIESIRQATVITVPSAWVAETFKRDMRLSPHVIPHGIDWQAWQHKLPCNDYILWNKNRTSDVCSPDAVNRLAQMFPQTRFLATYANPQPTPNIRTTGIVKHRQMQKMIQQAAVYLSTAKETFGIGTLEAMVSGVPVLGWANGGNIGLIQHGVSGYLAQPGNYDDLAEGLNYCVEHRLTLGLNGRELAKTWGWPSVCEQVAEVYRLAICVEPPTVSIVIPVYNKEKHIKKTIESALTQKPFEVIVINDGSTDDSYKILKRFGSKIKLVNQHNQGVAHARNAGINLAKGKYICCLDGDDQLDTGFLEVCTEALEADENLGIAYTGLRWVNQEGETDISAWPGEFDYERQLQKSNQIPTCCVFRRSISDRIGGYRQRYAPTGAGAEDAAFWTVFGSLGYQARKVTDDALFVYNVGDGHVSGDPEYREVNYLAWYPWIKDRLHPFASIAAPKNGLSHPVRQYDEPIISVVIPVGPGHEDNLIDALDSLEAQTLRQWEVIIVDDTGTNGVWLKKLSVTYPYIRQTIVYPGPKGAGHARNRGAELARGNFLFFLDADDFLNPDHPDALAEMVSMWRETDHAIYSDYIGRAIVEDLDYLSPKMQSNVLYHDPKDNEAFIRHYSLTFDCIKAQSQPAGRSPTDMYIWNLISTLIPRKWHNEIGGFDETMLTWEDWDYWLRMAKAGKCFTRIDKPFLIYKYHSGSRRELAHKESGDGRQNWVDVLEYLKGKHNGLETRMCNCGGKRKSVPMITKRENGAVLVTEATAADDFILAEYTGSAGQHWVIGQATFGKPYPAPNMALIGHGQGRIKYGRFSRGNVFPVHKQDIALSPHLFRANVPEVPDKPVVEVQPPEPLVEPEPQILDIDDLLGLPGIGPATATKLTEQGINTPAAILNFGIEGLSGFRGVSEKKAQRIIEAVAAL